MFNISATFEDLRLEAKSRLGDVYEVEISDNLTRKSTTKSFTAQQLSYILQLNLHEDGTPEGYEKMYDELEPLMIGLTRELRPIP